VLSHQPENAVFRKWILDSGGWSIPRNKSDDELYTEAIRSLYEFYEPANERLHRLLNRVWPNSSGARQDGAWRFLKTTPSSRSSKS
jgi:hypothetical protein